MIHRIFLFMKRFLRARRYGVFFPGTSRFSPPHRIRLGAREVTLSFPDEIGLRSDFINVILDDEYGLHNMPFALERVLDVGANIGLFSIWCAHHFPNATIHAYEPNPRILPDTRHNLEGTGVTLFPFCLGKEAGFAKMIDPSESRRAQTVDHADGNIRIITLHEAVQRMGGAVDLLKLDAEGAEWALFENKQGFEHVRLIRMEYHLAGARTHADFISAVKSLGFRVDRLVSKASVGIAWLSRQPA